MKAGLDADARIHLGNAESGVAAGVLNCARARIAHGHGLEQDGQVEVGGLGYRDVYLAAEQRVLVEKPEVAARDGTRYPALVVGDGSRQVDDRDEALSDGEPGVEFIVGEVER